jgi:8-oxo-dGTP pyrophosphatase MutT (NUDIX family)
MTLFDTLIDAARSPAPADLLAGDTMDGPRTAGTDAAVLVAITDRPEPGVILTVRRPDLRRHGGQVAFPGGRLDPGEGVVAAALREAQEEIGLDPAVVRPTGLLDPYRTITDYQVTPVLALIPPDLPLVPHEAEVADIFEAPLPHLLHRENHVLRTVLFDGRQRQYYEIIWDGRRIWGATAAMIVNLSKRLQLW